VDREIQAASTEAEEVPEAVGPPPPPAPRLQLQGEIARGGMGAVLKGRDTDLGRDVAVKVLLEKHTSRPEVAQRFLEEAQISGQLQHPGIVPIYELGAFADGRPYFTMKLVKGQTLAKLLDDRTAVGDDRPRFLGIFAQVCQTLAYAHARGVIHRDLKPSNVMVGAFGEVQVMDWGLAKVLPEGGAAKGQPGSEQERRDTVSLIRTRRSQGTAADAEAAAPTQEGDVLGTPAYMAPEQARGDLDLVDERADVFGLGAILCEILTGRPPFTGKTAEAQRKAQTAQLDDARARLDSCGADPELIEVAKQCVAAEPWERLRHAGEVATAVTAYQQGVEVRLRQAEVDRAQAQVKAREERKRRKVTVGLAAAVLSLVVLGSGVGLWRQRETIERRQAMTAALEKMADLLKQARWREATAVLDEADRRLGTGGPDDLRRRLEQARVDLRLVARLDAARLRAAEWVVNQFDNAGAAREYAAAFQEAGLGEDGEDVETVAARVRGSAVCAQAVAALDFWARVAGDGPTRAWLLAVGRGADPGPWTDRFRDPAVWRSGHTLMRLAREADVTALPPPTLLTLARLLPHGSDKVSLLTAAQVRYPDDFWLNFELGDALSKIKRNEEAIGYYRAALALRPGTFAVFTNLGSLLHWQGRLVEAEAARREAVALEPKLAMAHAHLGGVLHDQGRLAEAETACRQAIALDPKYALGYGNLASVLSSQHRPTEAEAAFRRAIAIEPKTAGYHNNLGALLKEQSRPGEAEAAFRQVLMLDPNNWHAHSNLGLTLDAQGRSVEAEAAYRKALSLEPKAATTHYYLGNTLNGRRRWAEAEVAFRLALALRPNFAAAHVSLGDNLFKQARFAEAEAAYRKALALKAEDARAHYGLGVILCDIKRDYGGAIVAFRKSIELNPKSAAAHHGLGNALAGQGRLAEAEVAYHQALSLNPDLAAAHVSLGDNLFKQARFAEAEAAYRKGLGLEPKDTRAHYGLGVILCDVKRDYGEAVAAFRKAIELNPKKADCYCCLGAALVGQGQLAEGEAALRQAIALEPKHAIAHSNLGGVLRRQGRFGEAETACRQAIALDPKAAAAHVSLGMALQDQGRLAEAEAAYRQALTLNPSQAAAHVNLGAILCDVKRDYDGAIAACRRSVELAPDSAIGHCNLGIALLEQGKFAEALAALRRGRELGSQQRASTRPTAKEVRNVERLVELEPRLGLILKGAAAPADAAEQLDYARLCAYKQFYGIAVRFWAEALADAKLADEREDEYRYQAARSAALAGCGQGQEAARFDAQQRARWRKQAHDWLRAELTKWTKQLASSQPEGRETVARKMGCWQHDRDLAGLRDAKELAQLPAEEQAAYRRLWADVEALQKKALQGPPGAPPRGPATPTGGASGK
jgi:serine/threonine-protein kinase